MSSTLNSSWKDIRPIRATESRLVRANAERTSSIKALGSVNWDSGYLRNPATPEEKIANGVPVAGVLSAEAAAPATHRARTASKLSKSIAPKPTFGISFSLVIALEEVPEETRLWKPGYGAAGTVANKIGNRSLDFSLWETSVRVRFDCRMCDKQSNDGTDNHTGKHKGCHQVTRFHQKPHRKNGCEENVSEYHVGPVRLGGNERAVHADDESSYRADQVRDRSV